MKIDYFYFLLIACGVCLIGLIVLSIKSPNGREPKEINAVGRYRIIKIEGQEFIRHRGNLVPLHCCNCCKSDTVK